MTDDNHREIEKAGVPIQINGDLDLSQQTLVTPLEDLLKQLGYATNLSTPRLEVDCGEETIVFESDSAIRLSLKDSENGQKEEQ